MEPVQDKFSVIIPTLQRAHELRALVEQCAAHPLVHEVLVINNAPQPLSWQSRKVRVLQQERNIYVNPAWNLGAREARSEFLAIINDDVCFEDEVFDHCAKLLRNGRWGIVGPDRTCFKVEPNGPISHRIGTYGNVLFGFGTFMALRKRDYVPIPEQMKIWGGDDWLMLVQRRPPAILISTRFVTDMSVTAGSPEFAAMRELELAHSRPILGALRGSRWWHWVTRAVERMRGLRHYLRNR